MEKPADRIPSLLSVLRVVLGVFVLACLVGPYALRSTVPIWLPFLIALGLELHFLLGGFRPARARRPDRAPQAVDRERYGYGVETDDLLLVGERGEEFWIPYSGDRRRGRGVDRRSARAARGRSSRGGAALRGRLRPPLRRFLAGLTIIGALALILW